MNITTQFQRSKIVHATNAPAKSTRPNMRILHLANHCRAGNGNVHVAIDLACQQVENGHEVAFASGDGEYVNLLRDRGVHYRNLPHGRIGIASNVRTLTQALLFCREFKPDIIHAHMMAGAAIGAVCRLMSGAPLITTVHNSFDPHSILMRLGSRIVAVSAAERAALCARGFPETKVDVVLNGTKGSLRESALTRDQDTVLIRPCVLTAAGLHQRKGIDVLIRAFSDAATTNPTWHLYIVGDGPERTSLQNLTLELGISDRVHFLGFRNQPQKLMQQADIFSLTSYAEPCSLVLCEARNAGCAIVATAVGGTPEILNSGAAGSLVPPGDVSQLSLALGELMRHRDKIDKFRALSARDSKFFCVERMTDDYGTVYNCALRSRASARPNLTTSYTQQE
ncbi:MAG TPA: glycosyltransferase family 4 protein [Hyphomicrobium sp.]|nr:glycosyltransferase family 4 protein [Hyphomicrobium sp.]